MHFFFAEKFGACKCSLLFYYVFLCINQKKMATIDSTLESIMQLDFQSREMLLEILQKRQIEARRAKIAKTANQTLKEYHSGQLHASTADEVIKKLNSL
jgi:hypothetical protein